MSDTIAQLQAERAKLETEHTNLLTAIRDLRQRAREKSLIAADTRTPLAQSEIAHWQRGIREHQTKLMSAQSRIGVVNKRLREQHAASNNGSRTREKKPPPLIEEQDHALYLSCFFQIARDSLDPRLFAAIECDAQALAKDYQRMHGSVPGTSMTLPKGGTA